MAIASSLISGASFVRSEALLQNQERLTDLNRQLATGERATTYGGLGLDRVQSINLRSEISRFESFQDTIQRVDLRINVTTLALERLEAIRVESRSAISPNNFVDLGNGRTFTQESATAALAETAALLNTQADDRYVFAGSDVLNPPIVNLDLILDGDATRQGLRDVTDERIRADRGLLGLGRLDIQIDPLQTTRVTLSEEVATDFGFDLNNVTSNLSNVATTFTDIGLTPAALSFDATPFDNSTSFDITVDGETISLSGGTNSSLTIDTAGFDATSSFDLTVDGETISIFPGDADDALVLETNLNSAIAANPNLTGQDLAVSVSGTDVIVTSGASDIQVINPAGAGAIAARSDIDGTGFVGGQARNSSVLENSINVAIANNPNLTGTDLAVSRSGNAITLTSTVTDITTIAGTNGPGNLTTVGGTGSGTALLPFDTAGFDNTTSFNITVDGETLSFAGGTDAALTIDTAGFDTTSAFDLIVEGETINILPGDADDALNLETSLNAAIAANPNLTGFDLVVGVSGSDVTLTSRSGDIQVVNPSGSGSVAASSNVDGIPFVQGEASDLATFQTSLNAAIIANSNLTGGDLTFTTSGSDITLSSTASNITITDIVNGPGNLTTVGGAGGSTAFDEPIAFSPDPGVENPASLEVNFIGQPLPEETFSVVLDLPDGTQETITLRASAFAIEAGDFQIGETPEETTLNFQAELRERVQFLADTSLYAASTIVASDSFFDTAGGGVPQRVDNIGSPETAIGLVDATQDNTVFFYTGRNDAGNAREDIRARVDDTITVNYGLRANEDGLRDSFASLAAFTIAEFTNGSDFENQARHNALAERTNRNLAVNVDEPSIQSIVQEVAGIQVVSDNANQRHDVTINSFNSIREEIERADPTETAVQLLSLQTQIEASLTASSRISELSLLNFI